MEELRQVAYFVATTEVWVARILPQERVRSLYSLPNSTGINRPSEPWNEWGRDWATHHEEIRELCKELRNAQNLEQLCSYVQDTRRVL